MRRSPRFSLDRNLGDLPSEIAAKDLILQLNGAPATEGAGWRVAGSVVMRASIIALGMRAGGIRGKQLLIGSVLGALAIESAVIAYTAKRAQENPLILFMRG